MSDIWDAHATVPGSQQTPRGYPTAITRGLPGSGGSCTKGIAPLLGKTEPWPLHRDGSREP